jgi:hypothetical protein
MVDGNAYDNCTIKNCQVIYRGGEIRLTSTMHGCVWTFEGAALNTIRLLQMTGMLPTDPKQWAVMPTVRDDKTDS